jgi:hypothetical protein
MDRLSRNLRLVAGFAAAAGVVLGVAAEFAFDKPPELVTVAAPTVREWSPPDPPTVTGGVTLPTLAQPVALTNVPPPPVLVTPVVFVDPKTAVVKPDPLGVPPGARPPVRFAAFPLDQAVPVSLAAAASFGSRFSPREVDDQLRDWLVITIASEAGLSPDAMNRVLFDLPIVREGYMRAGANFEYDVTRAFSPGEGILVALVPPCAAAEAHDHLTRIADEYRKNAGKKPTEVLVFEYRLLPGRREATVTQRRSVSGDTLFSPAYGYKERPVQGAADLRALLDEIDDLTFASHADGALVLGGRKHLACPYQGLNYEDIAAVWQAQMGITRAQRTLIDGLRSDENALNQRYRDEITGLEKKLQRKIKGLEAKMNAEIRRTAKTIIDRQSRQPAPGFGDGALLDPTVIVPMPEDPGILTPARQRQYKYDLLRKYKGTPRRYIPWDELQPQDNAQDRLLDQQQVIEQVQEQIRGSSERIADRYKAQAKLVEAEAQAKAESIGVAYKEEARKTALSWQAKLSDLHLPDRIGFSLDPTYDFEALAQWFDQEAAPTVLTLAKDRPAVVTPNDVELARQEIAARKQDAFINLLGRLKDSGDETGQELSKDLLHRSHEFRFQQARYDGDLTGTEVGMGLFYVDLLAKLWVGLDFAESLPREIADFPAYPDGKIPSIYRQQTVEQPNTRIWFGPDDRTFQLTDQKQTLIFAHNAARIFAASSNPLLPGVEVPPQANSEAVLGWFNDHYEEIARHEPQYQKLSAFMKWSMVVSWLIAQEQESSLAFLNDTKVDHTRWFPDWVKDHPELRFKQWDKVGFHKRGDKGVKTESLPILFSKPFRNYGDVLPQWTVSGGVGAPDPALIRSRAALPEMVNLTGFSLKGINPASLVDPNQLEHFRGTLYQFTGVASDSAGLVVSPRVRLPLTSELAKLAANKPEEALKLLARAGLDVTNATVRDGEVLLAARMFGRDTEFALPQMTRTLTVRPGGVLSLDVQASGERLGSLQIERRTGGFSVDYQGRDVARAQDLARAASRPGWRAAMLADEPSVEMPILLNDRTALVKLRGSDKWVKIEREARQSATVAAGWGARVSDTSAGSHGQLVAWVDGAKVLESLGGAEYLRVILPRDPTLQFVASVSPRGPPEGAVQVALTAGDGPAGRTLKATFDQSNRALYLSVKEIHDLLGADLNKLNHWLSPVNAQAIEGAAGGNGAKVGLVTVALPEPPPRLGNDLIAKLIAHDDSAAELIGRDPELARELLNWHRTDGQRRLKRLMSSGRIADAEQLADELRLVHGDRAVSDPTVKQLLSRLADFRSLVRGLPEEPWVTANSWERYLRGLAVKLGRGAPGSVSLAEVDRFLADLQHLNERAPFFRMPQIARPEFSGDGTVRLRFGNEALLALDNPSLSGRPVLVDMVGQESRLKNVVDFAKQVEARDPRFEFTFKVTPDGEVRYRRLPNMDPVKLIGDRDGLNEQPDGVREVVIDWLKSLAWEWDGQQMRFPLPGNVQLIVDHLGSDGGALNRLAMRVDANHFMNHHVITLMCDTSDFEALLQVGTKALKEGGALSVCFPMSNKVLQSRVAPLVVEEMLRPSSPLPSLSQAEMVSRAFLKVSERLDRCLGADDLARTLLHEFPTLRVPGRLKVFEGKDGISRDLIKELSEQLKAQARGMVPLVHNTGFSLAGCEARSV